MRPAHYTLTPDDVSRHASASLQAHLKLRDHGPKCRAGLLLTLLFYAAARITSLSDACKRLRDGPSDEAARLALLATLPDFAETQRRLNRALAGDLPKALRKSRKRLAIDLVLTPYHGLPQHDPEEIVRSKAKSGTSHFHGYATAYVVHKHHRYTVALTAVRGGEPMEDVIPRLLHQAARVGVRPCLLLLDRGFFSVGVIRYLQAARHPFLMPVICRGRKLDDPRGPSGTNVFLTWKRSGWGEYTLHDAQRRSARISVAVKCRNSRGQWRRHGRQRLVYAFWGLNPPSIDWVRQVYRVSVAVRDRDDVSADAPGADPDLDPRPGVAAVGRGVGVGIAERVGVVPLPGAGAAAAWWPGDLPGVTPVPDDVVVVAACGRSDLGGTRHDPCPSSVVIRVRTFDRKVEDLELLNLGRRTAYERCHWPKPSHTSSNVIPSS